MDVMKKKILLVALLLLVSLTTAFGSTSTPSILTRQEQALHVLNRLGFGPRPGEAERIAKMGVAAYVDRQLHPEKIADPVVAAKLRELSTLTLSDEELFERFALPLLRARRERRREIASQNESMAAEPSDMEEERRRLREKIPPEQRPRRVLGELQAQRLLRAVYSERQLEEVLVDFWMNHFNVDARKARVATVTHEMKAVRPHLWGRFEDLLLATAQSTAMLLYLDNARSVAPGTKLSDLRPVRRRRSGAEPEPERALGLNENYARELLELHTLGVDGGYSQRDVTELARVLTGWTVDRRTGAFVFRGALHDKGEKLVLGQKIAAGGGVEEGEDMIRFLALHPSTARHLATKLSRRFVSDEPPASLVDRVAKAYTASRGNLRETVRAVVTSREFHDPAVYRAKVKSPFHLVASTLRAAGGTTDARRPVQQAVAKLGEPLYLCQPPTGYGDTASDWVSAGALIDRMNFATDVAAGRIAGTRLDLSRLSALGVRDLSKLLLGAEISAKSLAVIEGKLGKSLDLPLAAGLVLGSPDFQRM
jgi:uncharacterized protein (DUF1800 family)